MKQLFLHRQPEEKFTFGTFKYNGLKICESLELPWNDNKRNISCIPGNKSYICQFDPETPGGNAAFWVYNVIDRDSIQIHGANQLSDLKGCIAPGCNFDPENIYIHRSQDALTKLFDIFQLEQFELVIVDPSNVTSFAKDFKVVSGDRRKWRDVGKVAVGDTIPVPTHDFKAELKPGELFWYKHGKGIKKAVLTCVGVIGGAALIKSGNVIAGTTVITSFVAPVVKDGAVAVNN